MANHPNNTPGLEATLWGRTTPFSRSSLPHVLAPAIPYFLMAYLTRRPGTYMYRLLLLPVAIMTYVRATTKYPVGDVYAGWFGWARGIYTLNVTELHQLTLQQGWRHSRYQHTQSPGQLFPMEHSRLEKII